MRMSLAAHSMTTAATHFSVKTRDGKARCGILTTRNGNLETPALLLYTRRGGPLNLTSPDMLATVTPPIQGIQLSALQFLENPDARILKEYGRGAHNFLSLEGFPILASNRDPTMYEYSTRPSTDKEVHVSIHSGGHMVSPNRYMETLAALKPDLFVSLCDEIPADAKAKRVATSIKRTSTWLDACLQLHSSYQQQSQATRQPETGGAADPQPGSSSGNNGSSRNGSATWEGPLKGSLLLAALAGGGLAKERARAAAAVEDKEGVGGYALCGLGTGEAPEDRPALIAASLGAVPQATLDQRPVFASGLSASPEDVLAAVAEGVDLLDCAFVSQVTAGGYALTFPLRPPGWQRAPDAVEPTQRHYSVHQPDGAPSQRASQPQSEAPSAQPAAAHLDAPDATAPSSTFGSALAPGLGPDVTIGADDTKINLWSTSYRLDKGPLLPGCSCFGCRRHSRAYVHHLLNTHEMLADVLLEAHNTSHMNAFCQAIREAIAEGRFEEYRQWFQSLRAAPLAGPPRHVAAKRRASSGGNDETGETTAGIGVGGKGNGALAASSLSSSAAAGMEVGGFAVVRSREGGNGHDEQQEQQQQSEHRNRAKWVHV